MWAADPKNTMWCKKCGQDVPGIPTLDEGGFSCPRCAEVLTSSVYPGIAPSPPVSPAKPPRPECPKAAAPSYDGWELSEDLRHVQRLLDAGAKPGRTSPDTRPTARIESAHAGPPAPHFARRPGHKRRKSRPETPVRRRSGLSGFAWAALLLGTMAFTCGGILLGWSLLSGRPELWGLGTPIALAGQVALLTGLILQLERLWSDSRSAAVKLDAVDEQIHELKKTTHLLGSTHSPSSTAFYAHLAGGANPQLLLNDLKGQLDLLALKISQGQN